jgi:hypothetical protein
MKIPERIRIGAHEITIQKVKSREEREFGSYDRWFSTININNDETKEDVQAEAFLHEIVEGINATYELKLDHPVITTVSEVLFDTIRRNDLDFREKEEG